METRINITINGQEIKAIPGEKIIEAARRNGIYIPSLCYLKELEVVASCRICMVEIKGWNGPIMACDTPVQEGMEIETETEELDEYRRTLMDLLLANHPNDCLTCEKAGGCELQDIAYRYGVKFKEHSGARRGSDKGGWTDTSSPYVLRDESKCILCGRCVRSCAEVETRAVLTFSERGFDTTISADADQTMEDSTCVSCNRCVTVCPVGALMDGRAVGKARKWKSSVRGVKCNRCDYGCNMEVVYDQGKAVAVKARRPIPGMRPLCLEGRLHTELKYLDKPDVPYEKVEKGDTRVFEETTWAKALDLEEIMAKIVDIEKEG